MQQLMTIREYAQFKRISENTVRRRIENGLLEVERFGRAVRIVPDERRAGYELVDLPAYLKSTRPIEKKPKSQGTEAVSEEIGSDSKRLNMESLASRMPNPKFTIAAVCKSPAG